MLEFFKGKKEMENFLKRLKFLSKPEETVLEVVEKIRKIKNNETKIIEDNRVHWEEEKNENKS